MCRRHRGLGAFVYFCAGRSFRSQSVTSTTGKISPICHHLFLACAGALAPGAHGMSLSRRGRRAERCSRSPVVCVGERRAYVLDAVDTAAMATEPPLLFVLDLAGTFAFALNGALTAVRAVRLDIVGVITLGMITALGGGTVRDVLLDALPPATFVDLRYLGVAAAGALIAFGLGFRLERLAMPINVLDAIGLSVFAVLGAHRAWELGFGVVQTVIVGTITGVGGGTIRDIMIGRIPTVLRDLYAIPAVIGAARCRRGAQWRQRQPGHDTGCGGSVFRHPDARGVLRPACTDAAGTSPA